MDLLVPTADLQFKVTSRTKHAGVLECVALHGIQAIENSASLR